MDLGEFRKKIMEMALLSIGMPVYNGEKDLRRVIDSILLQSFTDFELIISDNNSSDQTPEICKEYALMDNRIKYIRQTTNIGHEANFTFVFDQAQAEYFSWAAADDIRTEGFFEKNIKFLEANPDYSFSCSPNCFIGQENHPERFKTFSINGSLYERLYSFLDFGIISHGCFYSVFKREKLTDHTIAVNSSYFGFDWAVNIHLLFKGKFGRTKDEKLILGLGVSTEPDFLITTGDNLMENIFPFSEFSKKFITKVRRNHELTSLEKFSIILKIYRFSMFFACSQIKIILFRLLSKIKQSLLRKKK